MLYITRITSFRSQLSILHYAFSILHTTCLTTNKIKYRGVAQLVGHLVWERVSSLHSQCKMLNDECKINRVNVVHHPNHIIPFSIKHSALCIQHYSYHMFDHKQNQISGCGPVGRAPGLGPGRREFESRHSDQKKSYCFRNRTFSMKFALRASEIVSASQALLDCEIFASQM